MTSIAEPVEIEAARLRAPPMSDKGVPSIHSVVSTWRAVQRPLDLGHAEARIIRDIARHLGDGRGLHAQIHFELDRLRQGLDRIDRAQAAVPARSARSIRRAAKKKL